ncbi:MAG: hypothetical protein ACR2PQ_07295 [Myxococcota bacterium]
MIRLAACILAIAGCLTIASPGQCLTGRPIPADGGPTEVRVLVAVLDIDDIDAVSQSFEANVYIEARWHDPRLAHEDDERTLGLTETWHPRVQFLNQQRVIQTLPPIVEVLPDGEVTYRQRTWGPFSQPLDVEDFPFDSQRFSLVVIAAGFDSDEVLLVQDPDRTSGISPELSVADWEIHELETDSFDLTPYDASETMAAFTASFDADRHARYYVLKVVLPLVFILAMSWTVFWLDPSLAGTQIGVATTSMLTLIAYRFTVGAFVPRVPYLTRMDAFILASTILVFFALVLAVWTAYLAARERQVLAVAIERQCRWILPALSAAVFVFSFFL